MRELLQSKFLPQPKYKYSSFIKAGPFYYSAGMIALDPKTGILVSGGPEHETDQILRTLSQALGDFELSFSHLVSAKIYTTKFDQFGLINKVWEKYFDADSVPPVRTSIGVAALPLSATVEMEFVFYKLEK